MKKLMALILSLMMLVTGCALAEAKTAPEMFEGAWVQFDDGINVCLPADWLVVEEIPEEAAAAGIYYAVTSPDGANMMTIAWNALEAETTVEAAHAELAAFYADAEIMTTENAQLIYYTDTENNLMNFVMLDPVDPGMYMFSFTPISEEFILTVGMIASTICYVPVEEAAG